jgi:predicted ATPase with chaperone activity
MPQRCYFGRIARGDRIEENRGRKSLGSGIVAVLQEIQKTRRVLGPDRKPRSVAETGVRESLLEEIALKTLYLAGPFSVLELSEKTRLSFEVADQIFGRLRAKMLCEVTGMNRNVPHISITSQGRQRALELLSQSQYVGAAPVSLDSYVDQVRKQSVKNVEVHHEHVAKAFAHMVVDEKTLAQYGTALNSGAAVFIYGPPGVGKTAAAETLSRVLAEDAVWIPYAVEVDGQVITVFDPSLHRRKPMPEISKHDERWVLCDRPAVMVGGELTMDMLDLQFNPVSRYYFGPVQMKANNGVLIIDDFGRQRIPPEDLLNRWVVPLDRRIEFLSLAGGRKIEIPFEMMVVFASNRDPATLLDTAFLRRIQTKIKITGASPQQFCEIFRRIANERGMEAEQELLDELVIVLQEHLKQDLKPCYPRDLIDQICWAAKYENRPPVLDRSSLMRAVEAYFVPNA